MKRSLLFGIILIVFSLTTHAQSSSDNRPFVIRTLQQPEAGKGSVQIVQDRKIDELINKYIDSNPNKKTIPGWRIWIFSDGKQGSRDRMLEAKGKFMNSFPEIETYPEYIAPYYKIYVGDFRNLADAFRMKKQIETIFPNAFIVRQNIDYSKLK